MATAKHLSLSARCSKRKSALGRSSTRTKRLCKSSTNRAARYLPTVPVALPWRKSQSPDRDLSIRLDQVGLRPQRMPGRVQGLHPDRRLCRIPRPAGSDGIIHTGCMGQSVVSSMMSRRRPRRRSCTGRPRRSLDLIALPYKVEHNINDSTFGVVSKVAEKEIYSE